MDNNFDFCENTQKDGGAGAMGAAGCKETKKAEPLLEMEKRDRLFIWVFYGLLFILFNFAFGEGLRLGFSIFQALFVILAGLYIGKGRPVSAFTLFCGAASVLAAASFALWATPASRFFGFIAVAGLCALYLAGLGGALRWGTGGYRLVFDALRVSVVYPLGSIRTLNRALREDKEKREGKTASPVLWGLIASLPVLAVITPLLMDSDLAFENLLSGVWENIGTTVAHLILALLFFPFALSLMLSLRKGLLRKEPGIKANNGFGAPFLCGFLGAISLIYLAYMLSQLSYFFSGFLGVLPQGYNFTASEYARRGFFELSAVSVINLMLLFGASVFSKKINGNVPAAIRAFGLFICFFNLLLAGTSISKMFLYIDRFGLTRLRLYTSIFMIMMAAVIVTVILRYLFRAFPYMRISVIACTLIGLSVLFADADATIARYNTNAYLSGRLDGVDIGMLCGLSDAAVPYIEKLYDEAEDGDVKFRAAAALVNQYESRVVRDRNGAMISFGENGSFKGFNYSEYKANGILEARYGECLKYLSGVVR